MGSRKVFYDKDFVPKNLEELYNSGWKEYILYHIRKYTLHDITNAPEDLLQDMMVQMAKNNFVENFNPEVSDFTRYLHTFIRNFMSKPYNKEHATKNGMAILTATPIVSTADDEIDSGNVISLETLPSNSGGFADAMCLAMSIESDLAEIKTSSVVEYDGEMIVRDPLTVYRMLKAGYEIKEIAAIFGTSKQFVYHLRDKIADVVASYV